MKHIKPFILNEDVKNVLQSKYILNKYADVISEKYPIERKLSENDIITIEFIETKDKNNFLNNINFRKRLSSIFNFSDKTIFVKEHSDYGNYYSIDIYIKDLYLTRVRTPRYVYHVSDKSSRNSILKNGLIPSTSGEYGECSYDKPFVFASMNGNKLFSVGSDRDIWQIDTTLINAKWFIDFNFPKHNNHIITESPIPPTALTKISVKSIKNNIKK